MDTHTQQNARSYDRHAEAWHTYTRHNVGYLYLEKPAMERELPTDLSGKRVLVIGCGSGEELDAIIMRNPRSITALDTSSELLSIALGTHPDVTFVCMDMMTLSLPAESFDLVYASLVFHYSNDWDALLAGVHNVLKPGGILLFSTHHPGYWMKHHTGRTVTNARTVTLSEHTATLPGGVAITYYNHTSTGAIDDAVMHAGYRIEAHYTPSVVDVPIQTLDPTIRKKYENLCTTNAANPLFYIVRAVRT